MEEVFKDIPGWEDRYQVSNLGRVWSKVTNKFLTLFKEKHGYIRVCLTLNGNDKKYLVHRLVASAFIKNKSNKRCVNHINSNRTDNSVKNLEWCTHSENLKHGFKYGNADLKGSKHNNSITNEEDVIKIRKLYATRNYKQYELAKMFGLKSAHISQIVLRKVFKHV